MFSPTRTSLLKCDSTSCSAVHTSKFKIHTLNLLSLHDTPLQLQPETLRLHKLTLNPSVVTKSEWQARPRLVRVVDPVLSSVAKSVLETNVAGAVKSFKKQKTVNNRFTESKGKGPATGLLEAAMATPVAFANKEMAVVGK